MATSDIPRYPDFSNINSGDCKQDATEMAAAQVQANEALCNYVEGIVSDLIVRVDQLEQDVITGGGGGGTAADIKGDQVSEDLGTDGILILTPDIQPSALSGTCGSQAVGSLQMCGTFGSIGDGADPFTGSVTITVSRTVELLCDGNSLSPPIVQTISATSTRTGTFSGGANSNTICAGAEFTLGTDFLDISTGCQYSIKAGAITGSINGAGNGSIAGQQITSDGRVTGCIEVRCA